MIDFLDLSNCTTGISYDEPAHPDVLVGLDQDPPIIPNNDRGSPIRMCCAMYDMCIWEASYLPTKLSYKDYILEGCPGSGYFRHKTFKLSQLQSMGNKLFIGSKYIKSANIQFDNVIMPGTTKKGFEGQLGCFTRLPGLIKFTPSNPEEQAYLDLMASTVLGSAQNNRTPVKVYRQFHKALNYDLANGQVPLMTTKFVAPKHIKAELIWMLKGQTDSKILEAQGVNIWRGNSTREFLDARGLKDYPVGELGPVYGSQWRDFNGQGVDQLTQVVDALLNDPFSRRMVLTAWNPCQLRQMALPPCHLMTIFSVEERAQEKWLSASVIMRSNDMFLGHPYNAAFYGMLVHLLAKLTGMRPNKLSFFINDAHVYASHLSAVNAQTGIKPRPFPYFHIEGISKLEATNELGEMLNKLTPDNFVFGPFVQGPKIRAPMIA